jgi:hypothetical protein
LSFPAYDPSAWSDLFVASAGASAALTGLVFVAVSINLRAILKHPGLPERALETLILLLGVLTASIFVLIPDQGTTALGIELALQSVICLGAIAKLIKRSPQEKRVWTANRVALAACGTVPFLLGSISLLAQRGGGLGWVVGGVIAALISAVLNAWVLLIEILR